MYFEDTITYFNKIVMFSHRGKQIDILKFYPAIIVLKWGLNALVIQPKSRYFISFLSLCRGSF